MLALLSDRGGSRSKRQAPHLTFGSFFELLIHTACELAQSEPPLPLTAVPVVSAAVTND